MQHILELTDAEEGHAGEPIDVSAPSIVAIRPAKHGTDIILSGGTFIPVREPHTSVRKKWKAALKVQPCST